MNGLRVPALRRGRACLLVLLLPAVLASACAREQDVIQQTFTTPEAAAEALVSAAESFDVDSLVAILGSGGADLVVTEDAVHDRNEAARFAAQAREALRVEIDPADPGRAEMSVGAGDWPLPIPIIRDDGRWKFDSAAGHEEVLLRRIGRNELNAIDVCRNFVSAQHAYASERRAGSTINQYAQRIISTPGKRDGLAWQNDDGSWGGPVGEGAARAIAQGYTERNSPYQGYYFKVLKGQGAAAPMGELDFVVNGVMIGGFALVATPADYDVTGVMTFIVSHDGIVFERDLGPDSLARFEAMELYDPGPDWTPVQ